MALILGVDDPGDGTVVVRVDVNVDTVASVVMPTSVFLLLGPDLVADQVARRYAAIKANLRGGTP